MKICGGRTVKMGITVGCMASPMNVMSTNNMSSGPSQWTMTSSDGRRLSLSELKETIKVPLTEREVFVITKSWKTISRNMTHIGIAMFLRYVRVQVDLAIARSRWLQQETGTLRTTFSWEWSFTDCLSPRTQDCSSFPVN